jgi:protein-disulfide isomerase
MLVSPRPARVNAGPAQAHDNQTQGLPVLKKFLTACAATLLLAAPAAATDIADMTEAEQAAFGQAVRAYLLDNPEVIIEVIGVLESRQAAAAEANDQFLAQTYADDLFNDGYSFVGGNPEGDLNLVEFVDYRCGYCRKAHPEIEQLLETDGNIRFVLKEYPILGEESVIAARFAIAIRMIYGAEVYKEVHDTMMTSQFAMTEPVLRRLAGQFDLDADAVLAEMVSDAVSAEINANRLLGQQLQIDGTPTFVLESSFLRGYVPYDQMLAYVTQIRAN